MMPSVMLRDTKPEDASFIYSTWLRCYQDTSSWARLMPSRIFFDNHKKVIQRILGDSHVLVAANPEDPDQVFGYIVFQASGGGVAVLHWVYVKETFRQLGIARDLFQVAKRIADHDESLPVAATHSNVRWELLAPKWNLVFNPYLLGAPHASDLSEAG